MDDRSPDTVAGADTETDPMVEVSGNHMPLSQLVAMVTSLSRERPNLFGFLKSFQSSPEEMTLFFRQMIREDYDNHGQKMIAAVNQPSAPPLQEHLDGEDVLGGSGGVAVNLPPPPLDSTRSKSLQESLELAERLEAEEAAREQQEQQEMLEQARALAALLEEEDQEEYRRKTQFFYCEICMDTEASINGAITLDCDHRFCEECLSGFICNKIDCHEVSESDLKCPRLDCLCFLSHATLRGLTEGLGRPEVYEKFLTFCTDQYLEKAIESGGAMRCPSLNCNYVFQWRPEGSSFAFQCENCQSQYCLNCSLVESSSGQEGGGGGIGPGHAPLTCEQQREKMEQQEEERVKFEEWKEMNARATELFDQMVQSNGWKRCPSCKSVIERTAGCDHMTCKTCKCNFCFVCGKYNESAPTRRGDCGTTCRGRS